MIYYIVCSIIIVAFFALLLKQLCVDLKNAQNAWFRIAFCIVLAALFKFDFGITFCGLEYEDSYAYSFLAREFANDIYTQSFLSEGIGIGSLTSPVLMQTYGGHFITYSVLLSLPIRLFGFSFTVISITTSLLQFLSLVILSVFLRPTDSLRWMIAPIVYCISPIINVFGNTYLCEPFSGLLVLSFIYLYYKQIGKEKVSISIMIAFLIAIMTKRENLVLMTIPLIHYCYIVIKNKVLLKGKELFSLAVFCLLIFVYLIFVQNIFAIELTEAQDIETSTFSFLYFCRLAPVFIKSLLNPYYFGITTIILLSLIARSFYLKSLSVNEFALISVWLLYFLLYTFHYRGYFFVQGESVSEFDTFRYLNNYYCVTPILISLLIKDLSNRKFAYCIFVMLLLLSIYPTMTLRRNFNEDEWFCRFDAPNKALDIIKNEETTFSSVIISTDVLTLQNLGDETLFVCDAVHYDKLDFNKTGFQYYMLCRDGDIEYLQQRYGPTIDINRWTMLFDFGNGSKLFKYRRAE